MQEQINAIVNAQTKAEEVDHFNDQKYGNEKDFRRSYPEAIQKRTKYV